MRLGMNLFLFTTHVEERHAPLLLRLRDFGYEGVEVPTIRGDVGHYRALRRVLEDLGLGCSTVTFVGADQDPLSAEPAVRQRGLDHVAWAVEVAAELGAEVVCGPLHSALGVFSGAGPTEGELERSAEFLRAAGEIAAGVGGDGGGVTIAVEYLNRFESYLVNCAADTAALVRKVGHERVRCAYDTHHAHLEEKDVTEAIRACAGELVHVQLSESHRGAPGAGQVAWRETIGALREVGYAGWLMLESFSRADLEFARAVHVWRDVAGSEEEVWMGGYRFLKGLLGE